MAALSNKLAGPRIFIKRDDCTGLATGGNKTRKLEFLVGDARAKGADTLLTEGGVQSNHCRQTAAAAKRAGMDCVLVLNRGHNDELTGNLLLDQILGARILLVEADDDRTEAMHDAAEEVRSLGRTPYVIPTGGSNGIGAMGYASCVREIDAQASETGVHFDAIVTAAGSGGTQGGLLLGRELYRSRARIIGISDGEPREELARMVLDVAVEGTEVLGIDAGFEDDDVTIYDEYFGPGYGIPTPEMVVAVHLVAQTEGILLDPVYTGKAMAGLIDLVDKKTFEKNSNILFVHTGGTPALFAYRDALSE